MSNLSSLGVRCFVAIVHIGLLATVGPAFSATGKLYVADEESNTVSVIDATSFKKIASIAVGLGPHNVQVAPDGKTTWVTNNGEPGNAAAQMPKASMPARMLKSMPKDEHASMAGAGAIWAIDTTTDAVVAKVPVGKDPAHVVVAPDGRFAYVANGGDNSVSVVDIQALQVVATIAVGAGPHGMRLSPDGKEAWVANLKGGTVSVIDTGSRKLVDRIEVGHGPAQVGFTPDGRFGFVSLSKENRVAVIDPVRRKLIRKVVVGMVPIQLYATPDSRLLLVANQGTRKKPGKTVSVIEVGSFKSVATIETGAGAHGMVIEREGRLAFVTNTYANTVSVVDIVQRSVVATVPVGRGPNGVSMTP